MKPKNFPDRKDRRVAIIKQRNGQELTEREWQLLSRPTDIRIRGHKHVSVA